MMSGSLGSFLLAYVAVAIPLLIADAIWLGLIARTFYRDALGPLMAKPVKWSAAALFYFGYPVGLVIFALLPAETVVGAAWRGGLFGLFCYGTYDLVNHATIKGWPARLTVVDMTWGTVLSASTAALGALLVR